MANKFEKSLIEDNTKKEAVLKILEMLEGESFNDSVEILDTAKYFLKENCFVDYNLAKDLISSLG